MKVYILEVENTWDSPTYVFVGAFSTREKLDKFMDDNKFEIVTRHDGTKYSLEVNYSFSECELDAGGIINTGTSAECVTEFGPQEIVE